MAKSKIFVKSSAGAGEVTLNMVPMVDVAFLMILFFILTSQVASSTFAAMELAGPKSSIAKKLEDKAPNRVVVNVVCKVNPSDKKADPALSSDAKEYTVNGTPYKLEDFEGILREINARKNAALKDGRKDFYVEIRADKRVAYRYVEPIMRAAAKADVAKMSITALEGANR